MFVVLLAYTNSIALSLLGLIQILLAFPITLWIYAVVLRIKLFGVLQVCCQLPARATKDQPAPPTTG